MKNRTRVLRALEEATRAIHDCKFEGSTTADDFIQAQAIEKLITNAWLKATKLPKEEA